MESLGYIVLLVIVAPFLAFACCGVVAAIVAVIALASQEAGLPKNRKRE